jgi:hypothetical protein
VSFKSFVGLFRVMNARSVTRINQRTERRIRNRRSHPRIGSRDLATACDLHPTSFPLILRGRP